MKIRDIKLEQVAGFKSQFPKGYLKEIAFAGRSNVGKSSFINSIVNKKNLARESSKPGKTRTINFYLVNDTFRLVDLPGYGFARVSKKEQDKWADLINEYLYSRDNLEEVILIVDIRHKPSDLDIQMYNWIKESNYTGYVVATKSDKLSKEKINKSIKLIEKTLDCPSELIIPYSILDKTNKNEFLYLLEQIVNR